MREELVRTSLELVGEQDFNWRQKTNCPNGLLNFSDLAIERLTDSKNERLNGKQMDITIGNLLIRWVYHGITRSAVRPKGQGTG